MRGARKGVGRFGIRPARFGSVRFGSCIGALLLLSTCARLGDEGGAAVAVSTNALVITGTDIAAGDNFSCALMDSRVHCWGANTFGQLGDNTSTEKWAPVAVHNIADATALGIGAQFACAARAGGALSCWGQNTNGELGDGTTTNRDEPVAVSLSGTTEVEGGLNHACAVAGGSAYCNNGSG